MKQSMNQKRIQPFIMLLAAWLILESEAAAMLIPNQIAMFGVPVIVWGVGAVCIMLGLKRQNEALSYYRSAPLTAIDCLILFFAVTGGMAVAAGNYLYAGLSPLFIRELFTGYPLYTIRNLLYYPLEVLLMLEILICAQKAGDVLTKKTDVPWGAFGLFVLWGLPHIAWHGFTDGIVSALRAFIYCIPFYASGRNLRTSYISMLILWFL